MQSGNIQQQPASSAATCAPTTSSQQSAVRAYPVLTSYIRMQNATNVQAMDLVPSLGLLCLLHTHCLFLFVFVGFAGCSLQPVVVNLPWLSPCTAWESRSSRTTCCQTLRVYRHADIHKHAIHTYPMHTVVRLYARRVRSNSSGPFSCNVS